MSKPKEATIEIYGRDAIRKLMYCSKMTELSPADCMNLALDSIWDLMRGKPQKDVPIFPYIQKARKKRRKTK